MATERRPSTPHEFHFWTALEAPVGIGTIVRVEGATPINGVIPRVYGVVVEAFAYTDLQTPLHDVMGFDGSPAEAALSATERTEVRLFTAAVLRQMPEEPLQPVPMGGVFLADDADVVAALRMDGYSVGDSKTSIPIGVYHAGGRDAPVYLDADFLLGPEAAHLTVTGVSGLATKTSAIQWLLASLFTHFPASKGSLAAVCFNVKGPDLCYLDQPAADLSDADRALYDKLGVAPEPFQHVQYYAPYEANGESLATLRRHEALEHNVHPLAWGLREVMEYAEVLLNRDDVDAKADALIDFIRERVVGRDFKDQLLSKTYQVQSFADLEAWFLDLLTAMESRNVESWRTHHVATLRKVRNRLLNIAQRCAGLVVAQSESSDLPWENFADRTVYVIDVANLEQDAQDLIFARVVSELRRRRERGALGVEHVVVFVDELNRYAPNDGPDTYVRKMLLDLAERGRYLGMVLFGAQQFRSQVHRRVVGNAGTAVYGRMDPDELASAGYATLSPAIRTKLSTLEKGQLMVRHPHFTQPIFVRFPRPPVLSGRAGNERFRVSKAPPLVDTVTRALRRLDSRVTLEWVKQLAELYEPKEILDARRQAELRRPENVRTFVEGILKRIVPARPSTQTDVLVPLRVLPTSNPYDI